MNSSQDSREVALTKLSLGLMSLVKAKAELTCALVHLHDISGFYFPLRTEVDKIAAFEFILKSQLKEKTKTEDLTIIERVRK